jgi:hypothetical protein
MSTTSHTAARETAPRQDASTKIAELSARCVVPGALSAAERERMYRLMTAHYERVERNDFERDLTEKEWVILMTDADNTIFGFTTVMRLRARCGDEEVAALFSGDTVLDRDVWGAGGWVREWGHLAARLMHETHPQPLYWLLLTATHRTYRFLPAFFKEYFPRARVPTPAVWQERLETLVRIKFPEEYDADRGVVRTHRPMSVRQEVIERATQGISQEHAAFFAERNPGFLQGEYLVCITDLTQQNRTRLGDKLFACD